MNEELKEIALQIDTTERRAATLEAMAKQIDDEKYGHGFASAALREYAALIRAAHPIQSAQGWQTIETALDRYNKAMEGETESDPIERLRFFLSLALTSKDWLDVEKFIDDLPRYTYTPQPVALSDLEATIREQALEIERLKDIPMKYKRMQFNAELQDENYKLHHQLAAEQLYTNRLLNALETIASHNKNRVLSVKEIANQALSTKPDLSALRELLNSKLEEAATVCEKSDRYRGDYFAEKIRALKE